MQHYSDLLNPLENVVYCGADSINVFADVLGVPQAQSFTFNNIKFVYHRWLAENQIVTGNKRMIQAMKEFREKHSDK